MVGVGVIVGDGVGVGVGVGVAVTVTVTMGFGVGVGDHVGVGVGVVVGVDVGVGKDGTFVTKLKRRNMRLKARIQYPYLYGIRNFTNSTKETLSAEARPRKVRNRLSCTMHWTRC